jgi:DNA invertase Pin-like site-specific DNA recombinase
MRGNAVTLLWVTLPATNRQRLVWLLRPLLDRPLVAHPAPEGMPAVEGRHGFQRRVAEVGRDHGGLILGVERSRWARSSKDWHQRLEICALLGTRSADLDGIDDPSPDNDRWLRGLKGTMSEAERHRLKQRL